MRIALVSLHTSPAAVPGQGDAGGMNVVVLEAAHALAARGHEVTIATRAVTALPAGRYPLDPRRYPRLGSARRSSTASSAPSPALVALEAGEADLPKEALPSILPEFSRALLRLGPFDAVHGHYWLSAMAAIPVAAISGITPVVTLHTAAALKNAHLAPGDRPEPDIRLAAERALTQRAFFIAGSESELRAITAGYGFPARGSEVIHPGVDTALFHPAAAKTPHVSRETPSTRGAEPAEPRTPDAEEPVRDLRITVLGRVQPLKGQDLAVRAAGELARHDPELWSRCELVIAGEPTPGAEEYAAELRALTAQLGITDHVHFLPAHDRAFASRLLASSALALVPSHSETFGLVALEAAACGVPAVVGAHTGLVEAAPEGESAVHVRSREPVSWAAAIRALLHDKPRRLALGARAREHALAHNWDVHAARLEARYRTLGASARDG